MHSLDKLMHFSAALHPFFVQLVYDPIKFIVITLPLFTCNPDCYIYNRFTVRHNIQFRIVGQKRVKFAFTIYSVFVQYPSFQVFKR